MQFSLYNREFRLKKLSAFEQLHLSRKIAPLLPPLAPIILKMTKEGASNALSAEILELAELAGPLAEALAAMKDQDAEQVFTLTLASVEIQTDARQNVWVPLWIAGAKQAAEIELNDVGKLLPIVVRVVIHNLRNFTAGLLTRHEEEIPLSSGDTSPVKKTG